MKTIFDSLVKIDQRMGDQVVVVNEGVEPMAPNKVPVQTIVTTEFKPAIFNYNFVRGSFLEVQGGDPEDQYIMQIRDQRNPDSYLVTTLTNADGAPGHYIKGYHQFFIPYKLQVYSIKQAKVIFEHDMDLKDKRVVVEFSSKALGDSIAWMPYIDEFQKKWGCELITSTHNNELFEKVYPNIKFIPVGTEIKDVYAWYDLGWFYKEDGVNFDGYRNPVDFKTQAMQKTATDILGLEYTEIKPKLDFNPNTRPFPQKYVVIANHATLQAKYWNNPFGWQEVVDYLKFKGYEVVDLSKDENGKNGNYNPTGVIYPPDYDFRTIMNYIYHAEFFIGLGSGLSWLAWAMNAPVVLISGFSEAYTEMQTGIIRITAPEGVCSGCFNHTRLENDGDWNWCPLHKNDGRRHECTTSISGQDVIDQIQPLLKA